MNGTENKKRKKMSESDSLHFINGLSDGFFDFVFEHFSLFFGLEIDKGVEFDEFLGFAFGAVPEEVNVLLAFLEDGRDLMPGFVVDFFFGHFYLLFVLEVELRHLFLAQVLETGVLVTE
jgi:hypothetical protein